MLHVKLIMQGGPKNMHYSCTEQVQAAAKTQVVATEHSRQLAVYIGMVITGASRVLLRSRLIHQGWVGGTRGDAAIAASINPLLRSEMPPY